MSSNLYTTSRPHMPGYGILDAHDGEGLLPWEWALERLTVSHNYLLSTTRPDGRPHVMPVWGLWLEGAFYFGTDRRSRKSRNLTENPAIAVHLESGDDVVILEGRAAEVQDAALVSAIDKAYL